MPYVAAAAALISAAVGGYSAVNQAQAAKQAGSYNNEAAIAQEKNNEAVAAENIERTRMVDDRRLSLIRNNLASGGILLGGSTMDLLAQSGANMELGIKDQLTAASNRNASLLAEGQMDLWKGNQMASADYLNGASTLIGGLGKASTDYYQYDQLTKKTTSGGVY